MVVTASWLYFFAPIEFPDRNSAADSPLNFESFYRRVHIVDRNFKRLRLRDCFLVDVLVVYSTLYNKSLSQDGLYDNHRVTM